MNWNFRAQTPGDRNFVLNSWLRSFKPSFYAGTIPDDLYWPVYEETIRRILDSPHAEVSVACDPAAENIIYGYLVTEGGFNHPVCHWIYVKQPFRGFGVARSLVERSSLHGVPSYYSFRTADCRSLCSPEGLLPHASYNQSVVRRERKK